jgi:hypothetical protein
LSNGEIRASDLTEIMAKSHSNMPLISEGEENLVFDGIDNIDDEGDFCSPKISEI